MKVWRPLLRQSVQALRIHTTPRQRHRPDNKRPGNYLSQRQPLTPAQKRRRVRQQRLDLAHQPIHGVRHHLLLVGLGARLEQPEQDGVELGPVRVDEEGHLRPAEGAGGGRRRRAEVRGGVDVGEELADDGGLDDDAVVEDEHGHEAARVERQEGGGPRAVDVDDALFEGDLELVEGDVCAVGPFVRVSCALPGFGFVMLGDGEGYGEAGAYMCMCGWCTR